MGKRHSVIDSGTVSKEIKESTNSDDHVPDYQEYPAGLQSGKREFGDGLISLQLRLSYSLPHRPISFTHSVARTGQLLDEKIGDFESWLAGI